jgi:hypothetical protein
MQKEFSISAATRAISAFARTVKYFVLKHDPPCVGYKLELNYQLKNVFISNAKSFCIIKLVLTTQELDDVYFSFGDQQII